MSNDLAINLLSGILGAAIALIFRELFGWKGQGRIEAIRKYDLLKTDCYGILIPLMSKVIVTDTLVNFTLKEYYAIREVYARFSHRFPIIIKGKIDLLLFKSEVDMDYDLSYSKEILRGYYLKFDNGLAKEFIKQLINDIEKEEGEIILRIEKLELISLSFFKKVKYNLKFWSDVH